MKDLTHDHLVRFIGVCVTSPKCLLLTEYCPRGSLEDILGNDQIQLDWMFCCSLMHDIVKVRVWLILAIPTALNWIPLPQLLRWFLRFVKRIKLIQFWKNSFRLGLYDMFESFDCYPNRVITPPRSQENNYNLLWRKRCPTDFST